MQNSTKLTYQGPMIHVRFDGRTYERLMILVDQKDTTIQQLVGDLIREKTIQIGWS
jgi:ribosomal protein S10